VLTRGVTVVLSLWALASFILAGYFFFDAWQWQKSPDAPVPIQAGSIRYLTVPERQISLIVLTLGIVFIAQCLTSVRRKAARVSDWVVALAGALVALALYVLSVQGTQAMWTFGDPSTASSPDLVDRSPTSLHAGWLSLSAGIMVVLVGLWLRRIERPTEA
jgi:hypothetical protein